MTQTQAEVIHQRKTRVAALSVFSNFSLVIFKLITGIIIGSVSIISEAIHSAVDMAASIIALLAVRISGRPADKEYPFGYGKYENISGAVEALLIFLAAVWIIYEAVHKLLKPQPIEIVGLGIAVMLISALTNIFVSKKLFKTGKETDSVALQADAWHLKTDVYTSMGVMAGLTAIWIGKVLLPSINFYWIDPVAAILVALLIFRAAWKLTHHAVRDLLDVRLPVEEEEWIRNFISGLSPEILSYHDLKTRKAGAGRFIEFHIVVDPEMPVGKAHSISKKASSTIRARFQGATVIIHVDPFWDGGKDPKEQESQLDIGN